MELMAEFFDSDVFETIIGGVIVLVVIALAIRMGPLRFLGEMLAHLAFKILFVVMALGLLVLFAQTGIGQALGGVGTGLIVIFALPFLWLMGVGLHGWLRRKPDASDQDPDPRH